MRILLVLISLIICFSCKNEPVTENKTEQPASIGDTEKASSDEEYPTINVQGDLTKWIDSYTEHIESGNNPDQMVRVNKDYAPMDGTLIAFEENDDLRKIFLSKSSDLEQWQWRFYYYEGMLIYSLNRTWNKSVNAYAAQTEAYFYQGKALKGVIREKELNDGELPKVILDMEKVEVENLESVASETFKIEAQCKEALMKHKQEQ